MKSLTTIVLMVGLVCGCASVGQRSAQQVSVVFEEGFKNDLVSIEINNGQISSTFRLTTEPSTDLAGTIDFQTEKSVATLTIRAWRDEVPTKSEFIIYLAKGRFAGIAKVGDKFIMRQYLDKPLYD